MLKKVFISIVIIIMVSACGLFKKKQPPPPLEPTRVVIEFEAAGDINPDPNERTSPVVLRIYQLKSYSAFKRADFLSLHDNDEEVLGKDLLNKKEIILKPNEKRTVFFSEIPDETRTLGVFAVFRNYEEAKWNVATGVQPNKTNVINIYVSGNSLTNR
jgi:type VI secretion system protein VasD